MKSHKTVVVVAESDVQHTCYLGSVQCRLIPPHEHLFTSAAARCTSPGACISQLDTKASAGACSPCKQVIRKTLKATKCTAQAYDL